jgi:uncharacterized OsmC-like protein
MPTELFASALASCFCIAVAFAAGKRGIETPGLRVTVRADRAGKELRYERLVVETVAEVDDETLATLVDRAKPFCWVSNTLDAGLAVEYGHTSLNARGGK